MPVNKIAKKGTVVKRANSSNLTITVKNLGYDFVWLILNGDLKSETYRQFKDDITSIITDPCSGVILDLTFLGELDSAGIGGFIFVYKTVCEAGGNLVITGVDSCLFGFLSMLKLPDLIPIYDSLEESIAALRSIS